MKIESTLLNLIFLTGVFTAAVISKPKEELVRRQPILLPRAGGGRTQSSATRNTERERQRQEQQQREERERVRAQERNKEAAQKNAPAKGRADRQQQIKEAVESGARQRSLQEDLQAEVVATQKASGATKQKLTAAEKTEAIARTERLYKARIESLREERQKAETQVRDDFQRGVREKSMTDKEIREFRETLGAKLKATLEVLADLADEAHVNRKLKLEMSLFHGVGGRSGCFYRLLVSIANELFEPSFKQSLLPSRDRHGQKTRGLNPASDVRRHQQPTTHPIRQKSVDTKETMSGITDEAAIEGHDLIQRAEEEEEALHAHDHDNPNKEQKKSALGDSPTTADKTRGESSMLDKVKEALHMKK
ncbi:hypothetical protein L249_0616 [Ophiocordyceps polyrhachis-furcata BCC 54312]|uniref:Uncharacterized protein n=1 Tax=Ophiocordyceps polyrhachis-furcata BCC 54312 TaxID=1330021 RepID=A0A367LFQ1_9HYPO|nr:hypothetical protein L249_0616 [Ophiocordyceps polyrhachis-furcata BCC 54312]